MHKCESGMIEENAVDYLSNGHNLYIKNGTSKPYLLYLPLYPEHRILAETFLLTNYEINLINSFYLREWYHYGTGVSLPIRIVMTHISNNHFSLLKLFFDKGNEITHRQYFIFVCSFLFFSPPQLMSLMISMAKVISKLFITKSQILIFFQSYNFTENDFPKLFDILESHNNSEKATPRTSRRHYSLKLFSRVIQESTKFLDFINSLKEDILKFALPRIVYNAINKRIKFYYEHGINKVIPPKESCVSLLIRLLITNSPPPYRFDYFIDNDQLDGGYDRAVMAIKHMFDEKNNSLVCLSSSCNHRRLTSSCRSNRVKSSSNASSGCSRTKTEMSINLNLKSSKIVPYNGHPVSPL